MGETGVIYLLIPVSYSVILVSLLLLSGVVRFFQEARFLGGYLLFGGLTFIPGFLLGLYSCIRYIGSQDNAWEKDAFLRNSERVNLAIVLAPL